MIGVLKKKSNTEITEVNKSFSVFNLVNELYCFVPGLEHKNKLVLIRNITMLLVNRNL